MLNSSAQNVNSLYIPIISSFVNEDFVKHSFHIKNIATVDHVDFVFNNAKGRREAFIHIYSWKDNKDSTDCLVSFPSKSSNANSIAHHAAGFWLISFSFFSNHSLILSRFSIFRISVFLFSKNRRAVSIVSPVT